jgi:hypothetical protein
LCPSTTGGRIAERLGIRRPAVGLILDRVGLEVANGRLAEFVIAKERQR